MFGCLVYEIFNGPIADVTQNPSFSPLKPIGHIPAALHLQYKELFSPNPNHRSDLAKFLTSPYFQNGIYIYIYMCVCVRVYVGVGVVYIYIYIYGVWCVVCVCVYVWCVCVYVCVCMNECVVCVCVWCVCVYVCMYVCVVCVACMW